MRIGGAVMGPDGGQAAGREPPQSPADPEQSGPPQADPEQSDAPEADPGRSDPGQSDPSQAYPPQTAPPQTPGPPQVRLPQRPSQPFRSVLRRFGLAAALLVVTVMIVYFTRSSYRDSIDGRMTFIDCVYYASVTLSTTGYGDIVPATQSARLINALVITPMRLVFLIILVGTTLAVLTERTRVEWRRARWRRHVTGHSVIVGFGAKGHAAAQTLLARGVPAKRIVVVDERPRAVASANALGLAGVVGDGTRTAVLTQAEVQHAERVIIACHRDDTAVLTTLTARQLNPTAVIAASVREAENARLVKQSGATVVLTSSATAGRLLGAAVISPQVGEVVMDLLTAGAGVDVEERVVRAEEIGRPPHHSGQPVVAVVRDGRLLRYSDADLGVVRSGDRLIVIKAADDDTGTRNSTGTDSDTDEAEHLRG